ncbi:MAG: acetate--CoA ligase family protein, partial [Thermomicrobiales bacterium]
EITHKSDVGGVIVGVTPETMAAAIERMTAEVSAKTGKKLSRFLVQEMIAEGIELILGYKRDPLGGVILLGAGGTATEIFKDTVMRLLPTDGALTADEAAALPPKLTSWPLLDGYRGRPKSDLKALAEAIAAFSAMAASLGERLVEAEINPIFVLPEGQGVRAADGVVVLNG